MVSQDAVQQLFDSLKGQAADIIGNDGQLTDLVGQLQNVMHHAIKALGTCANDLQTMGNMVSDYANGSYREIPIETITGSSVVSVGVVSFVLSQVHKDIDHYREWKQRQ